MEFGIAVGHISAVDFAEHGERLGFTRCWVPDTPLIRSNLFATMAAVAVKTKTIKIGSGVAVCGMRLAVDAANGIASINVLAPGRTFAVIGAGNTAMRMLGQRPTGARALREYVRVVKGLLCCGMPAWEHGDLEALRRQARRDLDLLMPHVEKGAKVLVVNPTCSMMMRR